MNDADTQSCNVLVVDDEAVIREVLSRGLRLLGMNVVIASSAEEALEQFPAGGFDAVLSDISMPGLTGLDLLRQVKELDPDTPFLLMTGHADIESAREAMRHGAEDYLIKPFALADVELALRRGIEKKRLVELNRAYQYRLEEMVEERTMKLREAKLELERLLSENKQAHLESIIVLSQVLESKDEDTGNHIKRVAHYCEAIARSIGLSEEEAGQIAYSSPMHDIGKVAIDPALLKKKGKLTEGEFEEMKQHTVRGAEILDGVSFLEKAKEIALSHHEKFDGSGYPHGLAGEDIPLSARIVAVADVFDALLSERCYKPAWPLKEAVAYLEKESGRHFDPKVVLALISQLSEVQEIRRNLPDRLFVESTPAP